MPYPNFHAARINNPGKYTGIKYGKDKGGPGVDFIFGFLKGGGSEIQAVRFDASKFDEAAARKWIADHKEFKPIDFEPASGGDEKKFAEDSKIADWIAVAKAGKYPQGDLTEKLFDELVSNFNPQEHEPPHVIGHITEDHNSRPALGWIAGLKRAGEFLYAKSKQIAGELDLSVREGLFKKRSIAIRYDAQGKPYLHHLAWLGATVPACKGLPDVYAEGLAVSYSDENHGSQKSFESLINTLTHKGQKMKEYSETEINALQEKAARDAIAASELKFKEDLANGVKDATKKTEAEVRAKVEAEFAEKVKAEKAQVNHRAAIDAFVDKAVTDGLITPAQVKTGIRAVLYSLVAPAPIEYKEGDKDVKTDVLSVVKAFISAYAEGGTEGGEVDPPAPGAEGPGASYAEEKKKAQEIMKANPGMSFGDAVKKARIK